MRTRLIVLLAALAMIAAACGGGEEAEPDPTVVITTDSSTTTTAADTTTTVAGTEEQTSLEGFLSDAAAGADESYRFMATITSTGPALVAEGLTDGMNMTVTSAIDPANNATYVLMDLGDIFNSMPGNPGADELTPEQIAALSEPIETITIGNESWTRMGFFSVMFGIDPSFYVEGQGDMIGVQDMAADFAAPEDFTQLFEDADAEVQDLGIETIRGVETRHIRAIVDGEKMAETVDPAERAEFEANFPSDVEFPIDVWIGEEDGRLYRYIFDMTEEIIAATNDPDMEGIDSLRVEVEAWDYGADMGITAPSPDMVVTEEELAASLFGG